MQIPVQQVQNGAYKSAFSTIPRCYCQWTTLGMSKLQVMSIKSRKWATGLLNSVSMLGFCVFFKVDTFGMVSDSVCISEKIYCSETLQ